MAATHWFFHGNYSWSTFSSFCTFFNPMPPLPSAWLRQQTISWMGNLLASIPHLGSASILLFCEGKDLDVLRDSVIFFCPVSAASLPLLAVSPPQCFSSPTTEHSSIHHFPWFLWDSQSLPDVPPLFWSSHSSICSAQASESAFRKNPREFHGCPVIKTPLFHCHEPRAQSLVRN